MTGVTLLVHVDTGGIQNLGLERCQNRSFHSQQLNYIIRNDELNNNATSLHILIIYQQIITSLMCSSLMFCTLNGQY